MKSVITPSDLPIIRDRFMALFKARIPDSNTVTRQQFMAAALECVEIIRVEYGDVAGAFVYAAMIDAAKE